jgi:PEP-CTERM motif
MKSKLAILALVMVCTGVPARADTYLDPNGTIIFPDGSVITSVLYVPSSAGNSFSGFTTIHFQFAGGEGFATNQEQDGLGEFGLIYFTEPVSNLSVGWTDSSGIYINFTNGGNEVESATKPPSACCSGVINVPGSGYFGITWDTDQASFPGGVGPGGISSLDFTVPEPGTLGLVGLGFAFLWRRLKTRAKS